MAELPPPATMKGPVRAARSRSGRTAGRPGSASQEFFSEELETRRDGSRTPPRCALKRDKHRELFEAVRVALPGIGDASIPLL